VDEVGQSDCLKPLRILGLFAGRAMLACYRLERPNRRFLLGFAAACVLGSVYGFLGAWPFGLVEAVWTAVAFRRSWLRRVARARQRRRKLVPFIAKQF
jgi:hypothetical protein